MKQRVTLLLVCLLASARVFADYALPPVQERLVLLVDLKDVQLSQRGLTLALGGAQHKFKVDRFWMQHRIWSDGICTGVQDSDPKSSAWRVKEVQRAITAKQNSLLLVELLSIRDKPEFFVTYLKIFEPETEYRRYFPTQTFYDTIALPFSATPASEDGFVAELRKATGKSQERLGQVKDSGRGSAEGK